MPNPKDYMDDDHEYVRGYVRRKPDTYTTTEPRYISWFWRIAWYWRLLIMLGAVALIVVFLIKNPLILLGVLAVVGLWYWFLHPTRLKRKDAKIARRTWRKLI